MGLRYAAVNDFPDYRVGTDGSYWSKKTGEWKRLATSPTSNGYRCVILCGGNNGRRRWVHFHVLMLETFRGPCSPGQQARHWNGNKGDNALRNLLWGTPHQNAADRELRGKHSRGEQNGNATLTERQVRAIWSRLRVGEQRAPLSREFRVTYQTIRAIDLGQRWKHLRLLVKKGKKSA